MTERAYQVYLGNKMTGVPEFNFPWFHDAAAFLRNVMGWQVKNPAEKDLEQIPYEQMIVTPGYAEGDLAKYVANSTFTMSNAMEWDLPAILESDGIVLGTEWPTSTGGRWERVVAEALDRDIWLIERVEHSDQFNVWRDPEPKQLTQYLAQFPAWLVAIGAEELTV